MSSLTGLTANQVTVLGEIYNEKLLGKPAMSGKEVAEALGYTPQGLHQTAASLVKRGALVKMMVNAGNYSPGIVGYAITAHGRHLISRERQVHGGPS